VPRYTLFVGIARETAESLSDFRWLYVLSKMHQK
jgi:hypothetical protein